MYFGRLLGALLVAVGLAGCNTADQLADFFNVGDYENDLTSFKNPPLSVPPDFDLRPPHGSAERAQGEEARLRGQQVLIGDDASVVRVSNRSPGEQALVSRAGHRAGIDSSVRQDIDDETRAVTESEQQFVNKLLTWQDRGPDGEEVETDSPFEKPVIKKDGEVF